MNKKTIIAVSIVGALVAISIIVALAKGNFLAAGYGGLTPVSISNVQVTTNGQTASQIVIYATAQGGNYLDVTLGPNNLNSYLKSQGYTATKSVELKGNYEGGSVSFPYVNTGVSPKLITKLGDVSYSSVLFGGGAVQACLRAYPTTLFAVYKGGLFNGDDCYGAGSSYNNGIISGFSSSLSQYAYSFTFNYLGQSKTLSSNQQSVSFSDGSHVDGIGSLLSNTLITAPQYQVYQIGNQNTLVSQGAGQLISNAYNQFLSCLGIGGGYKEVSSYSIYNSCYSTYQQQVSSALADKSSEYLSQIASVSPIGILFQNGQMTVNVNQPTINIPTFTITLNAQSVGIERLSGVPQIQKPCANPPTLDGAGTTSTTINVKNTGNQPGLFDVGLSCGNGFSAYSNSQTVQPSQTLTFGVQVSGSTPTQSTNTQQCTFTVTDRNSGKSDSCTFTGTAKYNSFTSQCSPDGLTQCSLDAKNLLTCVNGQFQPTLCASTNSTYNCGVPVGGVAQCGYFGEQKKSDCGFLGLKCFFDKLNLLKTIIQIGVAIIVALIVLFSAKGLFEKGKMPAAAVWIVSLILAGIAGLIAYSLFWIGVLIGVIFLVLKILIPLIFPASAIARRFKK